MYAIFGDRRKLHGNETVLAYEWVEQLGLPSEVVLMMIQHLVSTRGVQFGFKEAQKLALELCEKQVRSLDAAEQLFSRSESARKGAMKIIRRMGKYSREPSLDEIDLYIKWTREWGYAPKAIESACVETTGGDPSFKYLDGILKGLRERSGRETASAAQVEKQIVSEKEETERTKEMLTACGLKDDAASEGVRSVYRDLARYGGHEVVMLAAKEVKKQPGKPSLDAVKKLLVSWHDAGLTTIGSVTAHLEAMQAQVVFLESLYQSAGRKFSSSYTESGLQTLAKWQKKWRFSEPLLRLVAEHAREAGVERPMSYMNTILKSWFEKGIASVEEARRDLETHKPAGGKPVIEQQYVQRTYAPGQYIGITPEEIEEMKKL